MGKFVSLIHDNPDDDIIPFVFPADINSISLFFRRTNDVFTTVQIESQTEQVQQTPDEIIAAISFADPTKVFVTLTGADDLNADLTIKPYAIVLDPAFVDTVKPVGDDAPVAGLNIVSMDSSSILVSDTIEEIKAKVWG